MVLLQEVPDAKIGASMSCTKQLMLEALNLVAEEASIPDTILVVQVVGQGHNVRLLPVVVREEGAETVRALHAACLQPNALALMKAVRESYERAPAGVRTGTHKYTFATSETPAAALSETGGEPQEMVIESCWREKPRCSSALKGFFDGIGVYSK